MDLKLLPHTRYDERGGFIVNPVLCHSHDVGVRLVFTGMIEGVCTRVSFRCL